MVELVVLLRGAGTAADRQRTIDALERNTPELGICFCDPNAVDARSMLETAVSRGHRVLVVGSASGAVTDQLAWDVMELTPDADVALLELGGAVGPDWHDQLHRAVYADTVVATSSAIPTYMLALHDPSGDSLRLPRGDVVRGAALGEPLWGCVYLRRDALNIAKGARCFADNHRLVRPEELVLVPGLVHVLATAVVELPAERPEVRAAALTPSVRRALAEIETAAGPLCVTLDLRCCAFPMSGTQVHALNLVEALSDRNELQLSILVPAQPHESVQPHLEALPSSVTRHVEGRPIVPTPHVFHRPYQVLTETEIADVVTSGVRLVVTHQDMILDRTPAYFASRDQWRRYTAATALTLVAADEVVFFSEHARQEAVRDGLVDHTKTSVVPPGTNHVGDLGFAAKPNALSGRLSEKSRFVFVIGNAYLHKNRLFALRVSEELRKAHGWEGMTVFAGGVPVDGSSGDDERAFLRDHEELRGRFVDLSPVTDTERRWLYRNAALVLFPTLYEGFGLVPFEAAAAGTPAVYSSRSSVAEFLPSDGALLDLSDVAETARRLHDILQSDGASDTIVRAIRLVGSELTWGRAADSYVEIYRRAMARPVGLSLVAGREVIVGPRTQMVASETERRVLVALRRNAAVRLIVEALVGVAVATRRAVQRFGRP